MRKILDPDNLVKLWLGEGWHYGLDYAWVVSKIRPDDVVLDVGSLHSKLAQYLKMKGVEVYTLDRNRSSNADFIGDFLSMDDLPSVTVLTWVSSIEHNSPERIASLVEKSLSLGRFVGTVPVVKESFWDNKTNAWLMSDFLGEPFEGDYDAIWERYRNDTELMIRYADRFGELTEQSPYYLTAGVELVA